MKISANDVRYIAKLARLRLNEEEADKLSKELENILTHFQSLDHMNLDNIDLQTLTDNLEPIVRTDVVTGFEEKAKLFQNMKFMLGDYFQVPKIIK